jgi:hypothetical protein
MDHSESSIGEPETSTIEKFRESFTSIDTEVGVIAT